jgi:putative sigma-54 modulation protein
MDIRIFARNIELNPDAERYIQKKFSRIERHLRPISDAKLEVSRTSARSQADRIVAQMTVTANGYTLRGQESGQNLFAAIDAATDVLDRQIQRFKGKVYRSELARRSARPEPAAESAPMATEEPEEGIADELGKVVRTKRFQMTPMTVEDAITQMELLDHDFFLFFNIDSSEYNVVYRRQDGDYGVIEPELV